ncbi:hypothetical protein GLOTRDRAFT_138856 [Gloeophyllum trabeum ATCC 11539]|uniref:RNA exonuclease 4 n=1 Tax=Gloeophyllum trabeum (strain ATCC 11539 / FP-39264 / Madison 617) TaxID=670483 RepID=S7RLG1_GLOTA|nr:uncharacterized protein GLOTRDRAFT_138856 [Gloeophyllum trabeum ATCC 11539]EPQ55245.1 hypothetical protein GLOTRDRAFT_138856 [Gloeophyllum trabeum ATCC 11539]
MTHSRAQAKPSGNWLALKKKASISSTKSSKSQSGDDRPRKRQRSERQTSVATVSSVDSAEFKHASSSKASAFVSPSAADLPASKNGESLPWLRQMILGELEYTTAQQAPGKYLALDCEMVGVGIDGAESSLARVSLVNYYGAVQLDEFVRQRERVVDYRTQYSGIRPADMVNAKPFNEVQAKVAELLKDRILVGHAVFNDLKALLLSHPRPQTRDTQHLAGKHKLTRSRYPALRNLVQQELGMTIQSGEHSSVTDARATMALYRLHRKEWERGKRMPLPELLGAISKGNSKKRKHDSVDGQESDPTTEFPGGGRKGISSGLSVVVKRSWNHKTEEGVEERSHSSAGKKKGSTQWWKQLGDGPAKGSISSKAR